jgi:hypothetical protein
MVSQLKACERNPIRHREGDGGAAPGIVDRPPPLDLIYLLHPLTLLVSSSQYENQVVANFAGDPDGETHMDHDSEAASTVDDPERYPIDC